MTKPLFMWAGGKTKMLKHYVNIERPVYDTYVEPFFGGGAMFLNERPSKSIINDINPEIMGIYKGVKNDPQSFIDASRVYADRYFKVDDRKSFYYELREEYWANPTPSHLYILMKLGFNGIWQTCKASNGLFGTPAGLLNHTKMEQIIDPANIREWSQRLKDTDINIGGYNDLTIPDNSFVYLDPPYRDSFTAYGGTFDDDHQKELVDWAKKQSEHSTVWLANREVEGETFFESLLPDSKFHYFDVTYTAGRRKKTDDGYEAKKAREFVIEV